MEMNTAATGVDAATRTASSSRCHGRLLVDNTTGGRLLSHSTTDKWHVVGAAARTDGVFTLVQHHGQSSRLVKDMATATSL
ncbi:hypothetical protein E2562_001736 [Oryza meyeriana var. granulata]|uniref:Uncharacterized protein n=1 Tax=Oryza meyeriana var. granulata TaxID=110450 RepID=A0A6G1CBP1_9ORYZ|nr:hypothetical protein E2562_001736 [Oryza meyeriana var. granulata]